MATGDLVQNTCDFFSKRGGGRLDTDSGTSHHITLQVSTASRRPFTADSDKDQVRFQQPTPTRRGLIWGGGGSLPHGSYVVQMGEECDVGNAQRQPLRPNQQKPDRQTQAGDIWRDNPPRPYYPRSPCRALPVRVAPHVFFFVYVVVLLSIRMRATEKHPISSCFIMRFLTSRYWGPNDQVLGLFYFYY